MLAQHEAELQECSANMITLGDTIQSMQQQLNEKDYNSKALELQLIEQRAITAKYQEDCEELQQRLKDKDQSIRALEQQLSEQRAAVTKWQETSRELQYALPSPSVLGVPQCPGGAVTCSHRDL